LPDAHQKDEQMSQNKFTDWLQEIVASGWTGDGMYDAEKIIGDVRFAIFNDQQWDGLSPKAKNLFCAVQYHQSRWAFANGKPRITPPDFITECQRASLQERDESTKLARAAGII
jgi:hypothetical protein